MKARAEIRTMTKELVDQLLDMNTHNRAIKPWIVNVYKTEISNGNWTLTNQGIGVSGDMELIDGQHRLAALKELGYPPVDMLVVWGLSKAAQRCVDLHARRTMRDVFNLAYETKVGRFVPAICNVVYKIQSGWGSSTIPPSAAFQIYEEHNERMETLDRLKDIPFFPAPSLAALVIAMRELPDRTDELIQFMDRVSDGENLNRTMPEWHLRTFLESSRKLGAGGGVQKERYEKTRRAITAFIDGKPMGALRAKA